MPLKLENKITVPINSDNFRPTTQLKTMGDSANVVIPVTTRAERDALTKYRGLTVTRLDMPGCPLQVWDGDSWEHQGRSKRTFFSNTNMTGISSTGSRLLADMGMGAVDYDRVMVAQARLGVAAPAIANGVSQIYGAVSLRSQSVDGAQGWGPIAWTPPGGYVQSTYVDTGEILIPANVNPLARMWITVVSGSITTTVSVDARITKFWVEEYPA